MTKQERSFREDLEELIQKYMPAVPTCADDFAPILDALAEVKEKLEVDSMRYPLREDDLDDMSDHYCLRGVDICLRDVLGSVGAGGRGRAALAAGGAAAKIVFTRQVI